MNNDSNNNNDNHIPITHNNTDLQACHACLHHLHMTQQLINQPSSYSCHHSFLNTPTSASNANSRSRCRETPWPSYGKAAVFVVHQCMA